MPVTSANPSAAAISYPDLPVSARREEILAALRSHPVIIVAGETGSGKTTQLPKMCLEAGLDRLGRIGCTQPRRVAAMSVSRRVAEELGGLGYTWGREVGCKMRFNDDTSRETRIKFMTDGILLAEVQSDPMLRAYSALILDEAHERSLNIDFLLGYLQGLLKRRADLKLIITSATIDTAAFSEAFGGAPVIEVSGRLFPVDIRYAPIELAASGPADGFRGESGFGELSHVEAAARAAEEALIETDSGDVLVFMPTERDIRETREILEASLGSGIEVLALFGRMPAGEQQRIFSPGDRRRVVIATNVAETSLTIPRIGTVIDTGLARLSRYNPRTRTKRLPVEAISQSSANQRAGRAGRVRDGLCIRLYSEDDFAKRPPFTQPEIQRANLAEVILRMKAFRLGEVETFPFLNPPQSQAIRAGYQLLGELGALVEAEREKSAGDRYVLTDLGRELARLPLDPTLGRMLLQARTEGALPEMLVVAAGLSVPDPRERPDEAKEAAAAAHKAFADPQSDFLTLLNLWNAAPPLEGGQVRTSRNALRRFCKANYLSLTRMREWRDIYRQLAETMQGITSREPLARRGGAIRDLPKKAAPARPGETAGPDISDDERLYAALHRSILSGLLAQIAQRQERNLYHASGNRAVTLFPGSNLYDRPLKKPKADPARAVKPANSRQPQWIMAGEIVQTSQLFARTAAGIDPQWVVELGAHLCNFRYTHPQWSPKAGRVLVWERVLIHGLEVSKRQIDFGRVSPAEATELFIRGALVAAEGMQGRIKHRFFTENLKLRERIENALTKIRSSRVHDLDEAFYRFYAARIERVSSLHDLDKLVRARISAEPEFLQATEADLIGEDELAYDRHAFPDKVSLGNTVIPLSYAYNPGAEEDGVTLRLPLPLAERLTPGQLQWMVPGLREEQADALLRSLPKATRKALLPLEPKVREIAREFDPGDGDLFSALSAFIEKRYRVPVRADDWKDLPDYLRPRVEVIDRRNRAVAAGRDLEAVRAAMETGGLQSDGWERAARQWEKGGLQAWSIGDLPEAITVEMVGGAPLLAYPGLAVRGEEGVDLRLFRKQSEAESASREGVRRLAEKVLARDIEGLLKELRTVGHKPPSVPGRAPAGGGKGVASFGDILNNLGDLGQRLQAAPVKKGPAGSRPIIGFKAAPAKNSAPDSSASGRGSAFPDLLPRTACQHILAHAFALDPVFPLTEARFRAMAEKARNDFPLLARKVSELTGRILDLRRAILDSPKRYATLEEDVARLVPDDFLARTPHAQLPHLARYLRAVQLRAERAWINPAKDAEKARALLPFAQWQTAVEPSQREAFRWMLEEFRVSLFAQELGTTQPVSAQRLKALGGMG